MSKDQTPNFVIDTKALPKGTKREKLFEIDGTEYTIPVKVGGEIGIRATKILNERGEIAAQMYVIEQTIGLEALDALAAVENLPATTLQGILSICRERVFGAMEEEGKG